MCSEQNFDLQLGIAHGTQERSNYLTVTEYTNLYDPTSFNVSIMNHNIRSFNRNGSAFEDLVSLINFSHDIIVLSETWVTVTNVLYVKSKAIRHIMSIETDEVAGFRFSVTTVMMLKS